MKFFPTATRSILPLLVLASGCALPTVEVAPRYGSFDTEGHFGVATGTALQVPDADLNAAGFGKDSGFFGVGVTLDLGAPVFTLSTQSTSHGGSGILDTQLTSSDGTINVDTAVESQLDFGLHQFLATFDVVPTDLVDVGLGLGVTILDVDASVTEPTAPITLDTNETIPVPVLALRAKVDLGDFEVTGLLSGFDISVSSADATFVDLDLLAQYHLIGFDERLAGSIALGYRQTRLAVAYDDGTDQVDFDLRFSGPYLALVFGF